ncbi:hypothetical protein QQF64_020824 [Cirrhinus molitorella]|uniref:Uncharacterized protein n=1 Tax=Cirrhinus molitorella TaxID=172907 RepID=A0ABR3LDP3_9TELE
MLRRFFQTKGKSKSSSRRDSERHSFRKVIGQKRNRTERSKIGIPLKRTCRSGAFLHCVNVPSRYRRGTLLCIGVKPRRRAYLHRQEESQHLSCGNIPVPTPG